MVAGEITAPRPELTGPTESAAGVLALAHVGRKIVPTARDLARPGTPRRASRPAVVLARRACAHRPRDDANS